MKTLELSSLEQINGGGVCQAVTVADVVVIGAGVAAHYGWLALNPFGAGVLLGAGVVLGLTSLACAFAD